MANNQLSWNDPQDYLGNALGVPVIVTSTLRSPQHNAAVGGVPNSKHLTGQAVDFVPQGMSMADAAARLQQSGIPTTQILNEGNHIHVSYPKGQMAQPSLSDDDLLKSFVSGTAPKAAATGTGAPSPMANLSDDQLLKSWAGAKAANTQQPATTQFPPGDSRNSPAAVTVTPNGASPAQNTTATNIARKPMGFTDYMTSNMPFAKDVVAGGLAGLDTLADKFTGRGLTIIDLISGKDLSFSGRYQENMNALAQAQKAYETAHPIRSDIASVLSMALAGKPTAGLVNGVRQSLPVLAKEGAKAGAKIGGLFGLGTPTEGSQTVNGRAWNAVVGAVTGTGFGAAAPYVAVPVVAAGRKIGAVASRAFPSAEQKTFNSAKDIINDFAGGSINPQPSQIVPGSRPTLAESVDNPGVSLLQKQVTQLNPNSPLLARQAENAAARNTHIESAIGTPTDIKTAEAARDKITGKQLKTVFDPANVKPVDTTPVNDTINSILSGKSGSRPAVKSAMADVQAVLSDAKTNDPETLYKSVRDHIGDLISGKDLTKPYGKAAASQLITVRDALDNVIETGAPGFKNYLDDFHQASKPIDAMRFLQGLNLTDNVGTPQLGKVQTAIRTLKAQQDAAGIKPGKHVSDPQMDALTSLRDDLIRASNLNKGKAAGSDTKQNFNLQKRLGLEGKTPGFVQKYGPEITAGTAGGYLGHLSGIPGGVEVGAFVGDRLGKYLGERSAAKTAANNALLQHHLENILLNPSAYNAAPVQSVVPSLNQIMNSSRTKAGLSVANRLAISHQLVQKNASGRN